MLTMPEDKIQWHPGYEGGIEFRLRKYKGVLEYHHEHPLSKKAIVVDSGNSSHRYVDQGW